MRRFCVALLLTFACMLPAASQAEVNINVGVGIPIAAPVIAIPAGPAVVVIPGTPVYYAPGLNVDVFFYQGYWWTPYQGGWFRGPGYNGPWTHIAMPPAVFVNLPPHYKGLVGKEKRIPYGQFQKHWREWDRQRLDRRGPGKHGGGGHGRH